MSAGDYYGGSGGGQGSGYGGYRQQPYPQGGNDGYSGAPPPASYGESLQQRGGQRPHSPYSQGSNQGQYTPGPTPPQGGGYNRPPPPPGGQYGGPSYGQQGGYGGPPPGYGQQQGEYGGPPPGYGQQQGGYGGGPQGGYGYPPQSPPQGQMNQQQGDGERGFMGAVAGGAAGGFGGHKMGHGVLGAVGGAVAGSLAQDHFKHKKEEKKQHEQMEHQMHMQQQQQQQQQHWGGPPPMHQNHGNFEGNFSASSGQISLDKDYDLIANCGDGGGNSRLTSLSLNDCLTNEYGHFKWQRGGNFGGSARNVRLVDGGRVLEAELADGNGGWNRSHVFLDEKITNQGGDLRFLG